MAGKENIAFSPWESEQNRNDFMVEIRKYCNGFLSASTSPCCFHDTREFYKSLHVWPHYPLLLLLVPSYLPILFLRVILILV